MKAHSLIVAAFVIAGSSASAQSQPHMHAAADAAEPAPLDAMGFVAKAGASDLYEIQSSQLAIQKAGSPRIKTFARMMVQHHTMTTRDVTAAARAAGLNPQPPALEAAQAEMIAQLQPLSGQAFDRAYVQQQRTGHAMALTLHQTYSARGDTPKLKAAAAKAVPVVQRHISQLRGL